MMSSVFKRKIYNEMLGWKSRFDGRCALMIRGARRVGKSTIAEEFARNEYESYLKIDFAKTSPEIKGLFNDLSDMDYFFLQLQQFTHTRLRERKSVIIFDEVQLYPLARQAIKYLVEDGRYDYIETGSLISIRKNVKDILIPSEEHKLDMYPMDFEEFLWATGDEVTPETIRKTCEVRKPLGNALHRNLMRSFRLYMLIGGMPQAILAYLESNNLNDVDDAKREIIQLYVDDFYKIDPTGFAAEIYEAVPAQLSGNASRYMAGSVKDNARRSKVNELLPDMLSSYVINAAYMVTDPNAGMSFTKKLENYKLFASDTGLFITLAFKDKKYTDNVIYNKLLSDKLETNLGYVYENAVSQMLKARGDELFYWTMKSKTSNRNYEVDFLLPDGDKVDPIEVKSSNYRKHTSLDTFSKKYHRRIKQQYVFHTKDYKEENGIRYLPVYMVPFLSL